MPPPTRRSPSPHHSTRDRAPLRQLPMPQARQLCQMLTGEALTGTNCTCYDDCHLMLVLIHRPQSSLIVVPSRMVNIRCSMPQDGSPPPPPRKRRNKLELLLHGQIQDHALLRHIMILQGGEPSQYS
ncbi:hypothetical protein PVAP13_5NG506386 [Panicum virgatum]|uniref:Uncharacterized protein n=1 Tax=Panicum virgatum TaxID=38727 RepID=A0A8T0S405_PANVG|nr:hypothetical protein PVAP13_5NG506386 [Panicum virgatum]